MAFDFRDVSSVAGPLVYGTLVVLLGEIARALVVALHQRVKDRAAYRKQHADDNVSLQLRRIDDAATWRAQQEQRITILDSENTEKDKRLDVQVEALAQAHSYISALERERDWWQKRYQDAALELNELKFKKS